jgi:hypothetical protein
MREFWDKIKEEVLIKLISIPLSVKVQLMALTTILLLTKQITNDNWTNIILGLAAARVGITMLGVWRKNDVNDLEK